MYAPSPGTLKVLKEIPRSEIVFAVARRPRTRRIYFGGSDFAVSELDFDKDKPAPKEMGRHASYVTGLALVGTSLVSGGYDGRLNWWDTETGSQVRSVDAYQRWIRHLAATPDGTVVASVADDMVCRLWDVATGRLIRELRGHAETTPHGFPSMLHACAISPDGRYLATGDKVGHIVVWDIRSGKQIVMLECPTMYTWDAVQRHHSIGGIRALAFSPDTARLAVGGIGKISNIDHLDGKPRIEVFEWRKAERIGELHAEGFKGLVEHVEFHRGGDWLLAAGGHTDGFLFFCDAAGKALLASQKVPLYVHDLTVAEDGHTIYAVGHHKIAVFATKQ
jgi:WD40 repeat protein